VQKRDILPITTGMTTTLSERRVPPVLRVAVVALLSLTLVLTLVPATPAFAIDSRTAAEIRDRLERKINRTRERRDLRRLKVSDRMQDYAKDHAEDMARQGTIFHDARLAVEVLLGASCWGENVGYTSASDAADSLHTLFMHSAGHRENILRRRWTHMGIGVEKRNGRVYVVERFADAS
jgi:uncharacterized protein YkwD